MQICDCSDAKKSVTLWQIKIIADMAEKSLYNISVEPQDVDYTLRERVSSLCNNILNVAGTDAQRKGFGVDVLGERGHSWVLMRLAVEFDLRPKQFTSYDIATWISDYNRLMSTRNFTLTNDEGEEFGRAVSQWCMLDLNTRQPLDMSATADMHNQWIVDCPSPMERPRKVAAPKGESCMTAEHRVAYSDIDFNRHMNTLRYIDLMVDMLPIELFAEQHKIRMDVNFLHEAHYGQILTVTSVVNEDGEWHFEIVNDEQTVCLRAIFRFD